MHGQKNIKKILMYLIIQLCVFIICFIDAQQYPEVDQDRPKHVAVMTDCV